MAKIILCADEHIHPHSGSFNKMTRGLEALEWVYNTAERRGISHVVSLGDLFHDRERINTMAYHRTYDLIANAESKGITTYLLLGNHDIYHRESFSVHSLRPLSGVSHIIDSPQSVEVLPGFKADFMPFVSDPQSALEGAFPQGNRSSVLFGHLAVSGGVMNKLWGTKFRRIIEGEMRETDASEAEEIESGAFKGYEKVFLGHFHSRQKLGPEGQISYIGSPLQLSYSDAMDPKGIEILDTDTLETEFLENDFSPRYFILPHDEDLSSYPLENSYIRLIVPNDFGNASILDLKKEVQKDYGPTSLEIVTSSAEDHTELKDALEESVIFTENKAETLKQYLENREIPDHLDPELLFQIGLELTSQD